MNAFLRFGRSDVPLFPPHRTLLVLGLCLLRGVFAWAEPGDLNPWFATEGVAYPGLSSFTGRAGGMFVQPDGKMVLTGGGWVYSDHPDFFAVRYHADGSVDRTLTTRIQERESFAAAAVRQADGRMVVAGYCGTNHSAVAVVRYLPDGGEDITFGPDQTGIVIWDSPANDRASSVAVQTDGKILVAGGTTDFLLLRFLFDGSPDRSFTGLFGFPGQSVALFGPPSFANAMAVQPDGRIVLAGYVEFAPGQRRVAVARFLATGQLDPTFGVQGTATFTGGRSNSEAYALALDPAGRILLAGYGGTGGGQDFLLIRLNPFGALDPSFGTAGVVTTDLGGVNGDRCAGVALQQDGKIVAAGYVISNGGYTADPDRYRALVRYTDRGLLDTEFGSSGKVVKVWAPAGVGVSVRSDGGILVGNRDFSVANYIGVGVPDLAVEEWGRPLTNRLSIVRFGTSVGGIADETRLTLRNRGTSELGGLSIRLDGPNASEFSVGIMGGITGFTNLPMGASTTLWLRFLPELTGTRTATLHITSADPDENPFEVLLVGESHPPLRWITPLLLPCGTVGAGYAFQLAATGSWPPYDWYSYGWPGGLGVDPRTGLISGRPLFATNTMVEVTAAVGFFEREPASFPFRVLGPRDPGAQDLAFGTEGRVLSDLSAAHDRVGGMVLQPDGAILVVGGALIGGDYDFAVARYRADGSPDMSFSSGGKVFTRLGSARDFARSVAVQPDGRILVAGDSNNGRDGDIAVVRYLANGTLDTAFGNAGKLTASISGTSGEMGHGLAIQADGRIVVAGQSDTGTVRTGIAVFRFHPDGRPDSTFGGQGWVTTRVGAGDAFGYSVAIQGDGRIVVGGSGEGPGGDAEFAVVRYLPDGQLDAGFGDQGVLLTSFGPADDLGQGLALQRDGRILLAGFSVRAGSRYVDVALVRVLADGRLDPAFGSGGKVLTTFAEGADAQARSVAVQADGRIVVAGDYYNGLNYDFALARYLPDGSPDPFFGNRGRLITAITRPGEAGGGSNDLGRVVAVQRDGAIVVAGDSHNGTNYDFALARYLGTTEPQIAVKDCHGTALIDGDALDFGPIQATASPGCLFTVSNPSSATLSGLAMSLEGPNVGDFSITPPAATTLGPGESTTFHVTLIPRGMGRRTAVLHLTSNDADESPFDVVLTGTVEGPDIRTLGPLPSGMVGVPYDFTLEATGGTAPYLWKAHGGLPPELTLGGDGVLRGTPLTAATREFAVSVTDARGARSVIAVFTLAVLPAVQPGDLDTAFGHGGKVVTDVGGADDFGYGVAVQRDGRIVVAGYATIEKREQFALVRYRSDGSLDTTFGDGGRVTTDFGPTRAFARSLAIQSDGRILAGGEYSKAGSYKFALVRYQPDGALDPTFGSGGFMTNLVGSSSFGRSVLLQSDRRIVLAGEVHAPGVDFGAARWLPDGSLDPGFGNRGVATADLGSEPNFDYAQAAALQADDKIVLVGHTAGANLRDFGVVRLRSDGIPDESFGDRGVVKTSFGVWSDMAECVTVQRDGRIVVVGEVGRDFGLARYLPDGSLDAGFGSGGKVTTAIDRFEAFPRGIAVSGNGAIVVAGFTSNGRDADFALARYRPDGTPDPSFSGDGKLMTAVGSGHDRARSVVLQPDGRIVVAGEAHNGANYDFALVRYLGSLEPVISVEQPEGVGLAHGGPGVRFGIAPPGGTPVVRAFTIRNAGSAALTGLAISMDGAHAGDFLVDALPTTSLAPGAWVGFQVTFKPGSAGSRSAAMHLVSNDPDDSPFDIALSGTGGTATPLQTWRLAHFGSPDNAGDGADANDFDDDGHVNLWEYACGGDPKARDGDAMRPAATLENGRLVCTFVCDARCTDITWTVQASASLTPDSWIDIAQGLGGAAVRPLDSLCEVFDSGSGVRTVAIKPSATLLPGSPVFLRIRVAESGW